MLGGVMERLIENLIFQSRWLLLPFYFGLCAALVIYAIGFFRELEHLAVGALTLPRNEMLVGVLQLVDGVLVAGLLIMVVISGYENFVSRLDIAPERHNLSWLGKLDTGSLKVKIASSIVAISSIHLLEQLLNLDSVPSDKLLWLVVIQLTFVATALLLAVLDNISAHK
jgi:uncharacterized protein (TIGR00645 family)